MLYVHLIDLRSQISACCCCLPTPMTLASGGESDVPACGPPASFSVHLAISAVTPVGSVHICEQQLQPSSGSACPKNSKSGPHCWGRESSTQFAQQLESAVTAPPLVGCVVWSHCVSIITFIIFFILFHIDNINCVRVLQSISITCVERRSWDMGRRATTACSGTRLQR